ncbi:MULTISPECIES: CHASE domain-containing protein [Pseudoalteromonas]|uniref:Sensory/regulatory protein RpfC n=1 Tax=Pseudoalteromonas amylolytica TaxID=1859457 RepID=A0A1S1MZI4_9GAMM|nr:MULTISPECIES: CHASE domain-containing protein [Pseudoalteromonas]OHU91838.1 hybrid sensor histidine kinase/response regulator [Pseudoalteromonas sp. JW3]OHU93164.1 hybrid sensor histidine kinase/response regulator [Pseudoalteromonas amylolytica]
MENAVNHSAGEPISLFKIMFLPILIIVAGLFYGKVQYEEQQQLRQQQIHQALRSRLERITEGVQQRVALYQYGIIGLRGAVSASGENNFDYSAMQRYMNARDFIREFPGARGIGVIRLVKPHEQAQFVEQAKQQRPDKSFQIKQLTPHDKSRFIIQFIEPERRNASAVGLDIGSESMRRRAALEAAMSDEPRLTAPITLVQANNKAQQGFLILMAIYRSDAPFKPSERLDNVVGWSYAPILIDEILSSMRSLSDDIVMSISDVTPDDGIVFFTHGDKSHQLNEYSQYQRITLFGRQWHISLSATSAFIYELELKRPIQSAIWAVGLSLLLAILVFSIQLVLLKKQQLKQQHFEAEKVKGLALEQANLHLEQEVALRTKQATEINMLQQSILTSASYAIIATDEQGVITLFNPAAERLLGYQASELVGKASPAMFHLEKEVIEHSKAMSKELGMDIAPGFECFVAKAKTGVIDTNRWTYVNKNGKHIPVRLSITALTDEQQRVFGFLGIAYDLTEQLNRERALSEAKEQAELATHAKSEFLANMSHEIRTPMNGLYGTLQLLKAEPLRDQGRELLEKGIYSVKALRTIINDILDFSKIEAGKLTLDEQPFSLMRLVENLKSELSVVAFSKGIALRFDIDVLSDYWLGDEVRVRQILLNLVSNAIKFTSEGQVEVLIRELPQSEHLVFHVIDSGIGMNEAQISRLFQRFEQADKSTTRKYGGTGLGLAITHSLVTMMHGSIDVQSELNKGSVFNVTLPLLKSHQKPVATPQEIPDLDLTGVDILVAEDNDINQVVVKAMLAPTKARITLVQNGLEAIEAVKANRPSLVLMDIQMPKMDGVEACKKIKQFAPTLPIVALTANAYEEDKRLYEQVGFDGYVAKPVEQHELLFQVGELLAKNSDEVG